MKFEGCRLGDLGRTRYSFKVILLACMLAGRRLPEVKILQLHVQGARGLKFLG